MKSFCYASIGVPAGGQCNKIGGATVEREAMRDMRERDHGLDGTNAGLAVANVSARSIGSWFLSVLLKLHRLNLLL